MKCFHSMLYSKLHNSATTREMKERTRRKNVVLVWEYEMRQKWPSKRILSAQFISVFVHIKPLQFYFLLCHKIFQHQAIPRLISVCMYNKYIGVY